MTEKEEQIYHQMTSYYQKNKIMPSVRELQNILGYKSPNSIYQIMKQLETKGYLERNSHNKVVMVDNPILEPTEFVTMKVVNTKEKLILNLDIKKKYVGYKIKNDDFNDLYIKKMDYLIIEKTNNLKDNELGLFVINKKYRIMQYFYKDGFYILKDNEIITLYRVKIIGKVVGVYRKSLI